MALESTDHYPVLNPESLYCSSKYSSMDVIGVGFWHEEAVHGISDFGLLWKIPIKPGQVPVGVQQLPKPLFCLVEMKYM